MPDIDGAEKAGKGPTGKGPRREFRALTSAGQRHDTEWAEKDLQGGGHRRGCTANSCAVGLDTSGGKGAGLRFFLDGF